MENYIYNNTVFLTYTNLGYVKYAINIYKSAQKADVPWKLLIMATDEESVAELAKHNIPSILYTENAESINKEFATYHDKAFNAITFVKLDIISFVLESLEGKITHLVYLDSDIFINRNFTNILDIYREYDIVFQCDEGDMNLCYGGCNNYCTGFMMMKNTPDIQKLLSYNDSEKYHDDQKYINLRIHGFRMNISTFSRNLFPNGYLRGIIKEPYYILHYNYMVGTQKEKNMREDGHWLVD
jgi:hypothetical protein